MLLNPLSMPPSKAPHVLRNLDLETINALIGFYPPVMPATAGCLTFDVELHSLPARTPANVDWTRLCFERGPGGEICGRPLVVHGGKVRGRCDYHTTVRDRARRHAKKIRKA